ncbi:MAG: MBOAT family O-acyltransferase [Lysinibacillus sp.]
MIRVTNSIFNLELDLLELALPLAISFFTFQQIAYLVDSYRNETKDYKFIDYCIFITFFPQLIAGPIVYHKQMMPQFESLESKKINFKNISTGLFIFSIGLFKKVAIADTFAEWANSGYSQTPTLGLIDGWTTSLAYTLQLYFDFSGYSDMAIGLALMFNIVLPINFNSPYKALSIQEFWKRWHITLSGFFTKYLYIPLGGNRKGVIRTYINIMIIFFVSGIWHGAGWTFIFWGLMHGVAMCINRLWQMKGLHLNKYIGWFLTFMFVNLAWVFFRAGSFSQAFEVLKAMLGLNGIGTLSTIPAVCIVLGMIVAVAFKNTIEMSKNFKPSFLYALFIAVIFIYAIFNLNEVSEFLYFNF